MPLANVVPHVVLHQKTHVLVSENFFGRWKGVAAPCARVKFKHLKMYIFEGFDQEPTKEIIFISIRDLDVQARWEELVGCRESHLEEVVSTKELSNMNLCMLWVSFV